MNSTDAQATFRTGFSCSQAVLTAYSLGFGLQEEMANRIACAFGGGIARRSLTCGAVTGALMVIGLKYGKVKVDDNEAKEITYTKVNEFCRRFEGTYGSINCGALLGCDLSTKEGQRIFKDDDLFNSKCMLYVKSACEILDGMGF